MVTHICCELPVFWKFASIWNSRFIVTSSDILLPTLHYKHFDSNLDLCRATLVLWRAKDARQREGGKRKWTDVISPSGFNDRGRSQASPWVFRLWQLLASLLLKVITQMINKIIMGAKAILNSPGAEGLCFRLGYVLCCAVNKIK